MQEQDHSSCGRLTEHLPGYHALHRGAHHQAAQTCQLGILREDCRFAGPHAQSDGVRRQVEPRWAGDACRSEYGSPGG